MLGKFSDLCDVKAGAAQKIGSMSIRSALVRRCFRASEEARSNQGKGEQMTTATSSVHGAAETNERAGATISAATRNTHQKNATVGIWIGRVMSGLVIAFLMIASVFPKLFLPEIAAESMQQLGWNPKHVLVIAVIELVGTLLYAIPRTTVMGAVLLTGLFGGAVATHLRIDNPLLSHTAFPLYVGFLMWGGLWLRNPRVRALLPLTPKMP
jgi:uncharacterized membrane protein YphA (DoxX/SURF4 family)